MAAAKKSGWSNYGPPRPGRRGNHGWKNYAPGAAVERPWHDSSFVAPTRQANDEPCRIVKLMPDYMCELPLWYCEWWALGLLPPVLDRLVDLQSDFDANFSPERGWRSEAVRDEWAERARRIVEELREALPSGLELEVDLWPLDPTQRTPMEVS